MADGDSYSWIGGTAGTWGTAANWEDLTTGTVAAVAPGINDAATIDGTVSISGNASTASLTLIGNETVLGNLNTGTLVETGVFFDGVTIDAGATLSATAATVIWGVAVNGSGAAFLVDGPLQVGLGASGADLSASNGGLIQTGNMVLNPNYRKDYINVDATSSIEIGHAGSAAVGTVTVDQGYTIAGGSYFSGFLDPMIDNGLILGGDVYVEPVSGAGTLEVAAGGDIQVNNPIATPGLTMQLDGSAVLSVESPANPGNIVLSGNNNELNFTSSEFSATGEIGSGFNATDTLAFSYATIIAATYTQGAGGAPGSLALSNGTSTIATLSLAGDLSGDTFVVVPIGAGDDVFAIPGIGTASPGTTGQDTYTWAGATGGNWNTATNWNDVTAGQTPAAVAPGSLDVVTIPVTALIEGNGNSASLTLAGGDGITGDLNTGTVTVDFSYQHPVTIYAGATISAGMASINGSLEIVGNDALLLTGTSQLGLEDWTSVDVLDGGQIQTTSLVIAASIVNDISVDAMSVFEVGSAGTGATGALTIDPGSTLSSVGSPGSSAAPIDSNIVDNGLIESAGLSLQSGTLSGTGSVEVSAGGNISITDSVTSSGLAFQLDGNATLYAGTAFTMGNTIVLNGTADELDLSSAGLMNAATFTGFNASDTLLVDAAVTSASYTQGTLTLMNGTSTVAVVNLPGDYTGESFQVAQYSPSQSLVLLVPGSGEASPGTTGQDSYVWTASANGFWQDASNWDDITAGQSPAIVAPGSLDVVTIDTAGTLYGVGNAAILKFPGNNDPNVSPSTPTIAGIFTTDTLMLGANGTLDIASSGTVIANSATLDGPLVVDNGTVMVSGILEVGPINAELSGLIQAGSLILDNAFVYIGAGVLIGNAGDALPGSLTIDPGHTLSGSGGLFQSNYNASYGPNSGTLVDNGLISSADLQIGQIIQYTHSTFAPGPQLSHKTYNLNAAVSGTGTVEVQAGGTINLEADVSGSGLTFQLDGQATLTTFGTINAGNTITLNGTADTLTVLDGDMFATEPFWAFRPTIFDGGAGEQVFPVPSIGATIYGFDASDQIILQGISFNTASYSSGDLDLLQGTTVVDTLALSGNYANDTFMVTQTTANGEPEEIVTINTDSYSWIGGAAGTWGTATNWEDLSTGTVAAVAPGIGSSVTIAGTVTVSGTGSAASLTILGSDTVSGNLNLRTLFVASNDTLTINAGNTVSTTIATDAGMITVDGTGSALVVNGAVQVTEPGLSANNGGLIQVGGLIQQTGTSNAGGYALDGGAIEIGNAGSALAGDLTIDSGYTVSGTGGLFLAGSINTPSPDVFDVVDNGLITSGSLQIGSLWQSSGDGATTFTLPDTLTGYGTVYVQFGGAINVVAAVNSSGLTFEFDSDASLNLFGPVAAGNTIAMEGGGDSLNIGNTYQGDTIDEALAPVVAASILGFDASDKITFQDYGPGDTPFDTASFNNGTLSLLKGTSTFATLDLAGGDYTQAVFSVRSVGNEQVVTASGYIVACFRAGTRIRTPHGEVAVEQLRPGDQVEALLGATPAPISWIGYRTIDCTRHPQPEQVWPVRVSAGAFGPDQPSRDLFLSPDHAVFAKDVLIPVKHLINGTSVQQVPVDEVTYYHLELPRHDVVLAEGLPAESYLDTGDRSNFANGGGTLRLFPDFSIHPQYASGYWEAFGCAPLVVTGPVLAAVRQQLEEHTCRADPKPRKAARTHRRTVAAARAEPARRSPRA